MNPLMHPPIPIIDNLNFLENPFRDLSLLDRTFSAAHWAHQSENVADYRADLEFSLKFLYSYNGSSATFNSYRRDLERLLHWSWLIAQKPIVALAREDIEDFLQFCQAPPPAWIGTKNVARFRNHQGLRVANDAWRPFVASVAKVDFSNGQTANKQHYQASQASIKSAFTALSSFYDYALQEGLVEANPVALIRQKSKFVRKEQAAAPVRRISNLQWDYVIETAEQLAEADPQQHERTLFVMNCLYGMYLRISELVADERATPIMGDFQKDRDQNWWFSVTGKGNKSRRIAVCADMLQALKRYRAFLGLSALPAPYDATPLVKKTRGPGPVTSTRQIRFIVQACFDASFERMKNDGLVEDAQDLKVATVHWLRHTGISEDVKFRPREHVRDDAGHASMATTDRYIDSDLRERHESGQGKKIKAL